MLVNVVDVPPLCNFILPAIVRTGPLAVAISTAGASPALAKRMKREIGELFGEPYALLAILLNDARGWAKATLPTYQDRKEFFESIVNGDPDPVELLRAGDVEAVRELIADAQRCVRARGGGERAHASRRVRARPDGRRRRQARDRAARGGAGGGARLAATADAVLAGDAPKGDVLGVARIAGIQAAKRTAELIPLCHPLAAVVRGRRGGRSTRTRARSRSRRGRTTGTDRRRDGGDDRGVGGRADRLRHGQGTRARREIAEVVLLEKSGGRSGRWTRAVR